MEHRHVLTMLVQNEPGVLARVAGMFAARSFNIDSLVVSPAAYNAVSNCVLVCPITSNRDPWPWKVILPVSTDSDIVSGAILVDQIKSIDAKARDVADSGHWLDVGQLEDVLARLATLTN